MKIVTAAIIKKDNRYMVTRRASGEKLAGYWEFPDGKVALCPNCHRRMHILDSESDRKKLIEKALSYGD